MFRREGRILELQAKTVGHLVELEGAGLHSGQTVHLRIKPDRSACGIRFVRTDLPGSPAIASRDVDRQCPPFRTALKNGTAEVHTVEHLFSALAALGITDCEIDVDGPEIPGMDGSALDFIGALRAAGTEPLNRSVDPVVICERIAIQDGPASLEALPFAGGFKVTYTLDYPGHPLAQGTYEFDFSEENFIRDIAPARTFAIRPEAEKMRAAGFGKGANTQNTVIVDGSRAVDTQLRFPNEPVRHKILDLIGDLYVIGRPLNAHIVARFSGHRTNRMLALALMDTV